MKQVSVESQSYSDAVERGKSRIWQEAIQEEIQARPSTSSTQTDI